jgi:ribonuclease R
VSIERPGTESYLREAVYRQLEAAGRRGVDPHGIEAPPALEGVDPERLGAVLADLEADGRAAEWARKWYALRFTDFVAGRIRRLEGGDALLVTGPRGEAGYFIPRKLAKGAMDGDLVLVRAHRPAKGRRPAGERLPEAAVVKIVRRRHPTIVGTVELDDDQRRWLIPFDPKSDFDLEVFAGPEVPEDHYVVVEIEPPRPGSGHPRGRIVEVLGDAAVPGVDVAVVLRHFEIPEEHPEAVLAEAARYPEDPTPEDWAGREDLRDRPAITIDGASARDFDDAVSLERLGKGRFRLGVHIADVAHYVPEGSALDLEAYRRGTSVYYPERAIPMLPERISNGLCSLRPGVPRLAMSAFLELDRQGRVESRRFAQTVIRSHRRMTYDEVRRVLEEPRDADAAEYGAVLPMLREMRELMEVLLAERIRRGSIDFDLPEGDVILDTDGTTVGIKPGERNVAHRIIEEFMIAANEAVAAELVGHEIPALYRVHDAPGREDLLALKETLHAVGVTLEGDHENLHPSALQKVLAQVSGTPEEGFVSTLVLRTMQRALYDPECRGHYALASRYYTHFTSPIRRYPDLVVHRGLKALIAGRERAGADETLLAERLPGIAKHASFTERRAEQSERDLLQWKKVRFLAARVGETFAGRITGVQPFGLFVQLDGLYVDGLVPIRLLEDDYYVFEPAAHRLVGSSTGRVFQLADPIEVRLVGVSLRHRGLDLVPTAVGRSLPAERRERRERKGRERRPSRPARGR